MSSPIANKVWMGKNVVSYDAILDNIDSNPQLDDLNLFNALVAPDPADILEQNEESDYADYAEDIPHTLQDQLKKVRLMSEQDTNANEQTSETSEQLFELSPVLQDQLNEMHQRMADTAYEDYIDAAVHIACIMWPGFEPQHLPNAGSEMDDAFLVAENPEDAVYNRDVEEAQYAGNRKALSGAAFKYFTNMVEKCRTADADMDALESIGFVPQLGFTEQFQLSIAKKKGAAANRQDRADMEELRKARARAEADESVMERIHKRKRG